MNQLTALLLSVWKYVAAHAGLAGVMFAGTVYLLWPGLLTKLFQTLEDAVNKIKFTAFGVTVDFSQYEWDDALNHLLRDYAVTLLEQSGKLKTDVVSGNTSVEDADAKSEALLKDAVGHFFDKAPDLLRQYAIDKFGGTQEAAAEFLLMRIKTIIFDLNSSDAKKN